MADFVTVNKLTVLFDDAGGKPTKYKAMRGDPISELSETKEVDGKRWARVSFLQIDPAPVGWIRDSVILRGFKPELVPEIDKTVFVEDCLLAAWNSGANTHFLSAWAQFESEITNVITNSGTADLIGPFQLSTMEWERYRNSPEFGVVYETARIYRPDCQCDIAAIAVKKTIDAFKIANGDIAPKANELLLALRVGVPVVLAAIKSADNTSIADLITANGGDGAPAAPEVLQALLERNADLVLDKTTKKPLTIREIFDTLNPRLQAALNSVAPLIGAIDPELLPNSTSATEPGGGRIALRYSGNADDQQVYGHLVLRMQQSLANLLTTVDKDMAFGPETAGALNIWQAQKGRNTKNRISTRQWVELTKLPAPSLRDFCFQVTASFEGHGFGEVVNGDADGAVLTWGYNGFTFRWGHVQEVLKAAESANPAWLDEAFGSANAKALRLAVKQPLEPDQLQWGRTNLLNADKSVKEEWKSGFQKFGQIEGVKVAQLQHCNSLWNEMIRLIGARGFTERLTIALCYDTYIQNGPGKLRELLAAIPKGAAEQQVRDIMVAGLDGVSKARKTVIAAGAGQKITGDKVYRLEDWGLLGDEEDESDNNEIGHTPSSADKTFAEYILGAVPEMQGLFKPEEFFVKGSNTSGLNTDPPRRFWPNILSTARVIVRYRSSLPEGHRIIFNSVYRSPAYNKQIGGAKASQHMRFNAIDFRVEGSNPGAPAAWAKVLRDMRSADVFLGGVGLYNTFVHLDTRGSNHDF
ncbi:DUF882 domain-containing protein [Rhizobium leguminosarum bv. viciae]|uniref:YcbK family protein n=1 Tax=Rhizobium leguminosarum TaxID=384 RepID=UPI00103CC33D|nr:D-Ala-D-Ala carboxypeptidase family metallohydrolase [Rhizobium leguminosarum]TBY65769.1 DUF882 domain-containing protein [Rhizobium leguminosarum bv. viciae]